MRKNNWLLLAAVLMLGTAMAGVVTSSPTPVIRVEPKNSTAGVGETFAVNITVTGITEAESLYNWECRITFNPSILNAVNATEGLFLKNIGYKTFWSKQTNNTIGRVDIAAMLYEIPLPPNGAVGNGILATVTFKVVSAGTTAFEIARNELYTTKGEAPNQYAYPILHSAEGGSFSSGGFAFSQELIIVVVVIVAVGGGAGFLLYKRRRASKG